MGLFAFKRLREREALAKAGASFSQEESAPKIDLTPEEPTAPKRRRGRTKTVKADGNHD
jgi:hypothetical protein